MGHCTSLRISAGSISINLHEIKIKIQIYNLNNKSRASFFRKKLEIVDAMLFDRNFLVF